MTDITATTPLQVTIHPLPQDGSGSGQNATFWSGDTPNFKDMLDTINPLQHIPIISNIYQSMTGDTPSSGAKILGGTLFGGPIGLVASIFDSILQTQTGADFGGNVLAAIEGKPVPAMQAQADTAASSGFLTSSQRTAYNAYVQAGMLT